MEIAISNPEFYFRFFYVLSFLVTFVLVIIFSIRLKLPLWSVLLMLTTVSLCTIVGSRLSTIPLTDWGQIISKGQYEGYTGRFAVGGLLFGLAGLVFSLKILCLGKQIINLYAWIAPIGFGIQKIGCFFNGCCYGKQSDLPWSVKYHIGTNAHFHQWVNGIIDDNAVYALSVHPVQLYEAMALFSIAYIVWRSRKLWNKTWSTLIFSICLFFIFRFIFEFLRDPASSNSDSASILGITMVQWFFLITGVGFAIILLLYEKRLKPIIQKHPDTRPTFKKSLLYVLSISVCIYTFRGLFTPFELLSLNMRFIPAIFLTAYYVYESLQTVRFRLAATSFFVLPIFLISQTFSPDSTKPGFIKDFYQNEVKSFKRIDVSTSLGVYNSSVKYDPHEETCGTAYTTEDYKYIYRMAGAGFSNITKKRNLITTAGINLYGGISKENNLTKQWEKTSFLFGVNPYIKYDLNWVGVGAGVHLGNLRWVPISPIDATSFERGTRFSPILPEAYFRVGRRDILDLKYTYGFNFPTSIPLLLHEVSIGSGFGNKTEFNLRVGTALSDNDTYAFISAEGLVNKKIGLTFKYNFGNGAFYYTSNNEVENRMGRILFGANYRFGFKK